MKHMPTLCMLIAINLSARFVTFHVAWTALAFIVMGGRF
jgi:hypothetical protein